MSTTIEDKISLFAKVLFERIEEEYENEKNKIIGYYEAEIKRVKEEYERKKLDRIREVLKEAEIKKQRIISKALTDKKQDILKKKKELLEKLIEDMLQKVEDFLKQEGYGEFLINSITEVKNKFPEKDKIIVYLSKKDFERHLDYLKSKFDENIEFRMGTEDIKGGIIAESADGRVRIDFSVSSLLEEGKSLLAQLLFSRLGEEV
ncbi:V-type ATP synthase subunit E [Thermovenabulum sp.]|uniref:V-type ATP synthase subunit E n=1 Tax=Thermovenabulum sp. TaxID=3100335 RepID=UPI003C7A6A3C